MITSMERMSFAEPERLKEGPADAIRVEGSGRGEEREVREVLDAGVRPPARHRVGVQLLRDVGLDGIEPERRRRDPCEREDVGGREHVGLTKDRIAEGHIDAERFAVGLASEPAVDAMAQAVVAHAVVQQRGVIGVCHHLEAHEVSDVEAAGALQLREETIGRSHHPQIDVLRGSSAREPQLEHEAALEGRRVAHRHDHAGEETVEHEQLAAPREVRATRRHGPQPLFEGLFERLGRGVDARHLHSASPPKGASARATSRSSLRATSPRWRACDAAERSSSGERSARAQSRSVRLGVVIGTGPNHARSRARTVAWWSTTPAGTRRRRRFDAIGSVRWTLARSTSERPWSASAVWWEITPARSDQSQATTSSSCSLAG
jgi:hypothetical protein